MYNVVALSFQNICFWYRFYSDYEKNDTCIVNIRQKKVLKKSEKSWGKQQKLSIEGNTLSNTCMYTILDNVSKPYSLFCSYRSIFHQKKCCKNDIENQW